MRQQDSFGLRDNVAMSLSCDREIRPNDGHATGMSLHVGGAAIASHVLATVALRLGHFLTRQKADKLRKQNQDNSKCQRKSTHNMKYTQSA